MISALVYYLTSHNFEYPDKWIKAIISCYNNDEKKLTPNKMFSNIAFIDTGGASAIFGAYFGIMIDTVYMKGTPYDINRTPFWKSLLRIIVTAACVSPALLPYILISDDKPIMIVYVFKRTVPFFFAMLLLFSAVKLAHIKLKLVNFDSLY